MGKIIKIFEEFQNVTLDTVLSECKPYIDILKDCKKGKLFVRGINEKNIDIQKFEMLDSRQPKDTFIDSHNMFNTFFYDNFGWNVRDGVFCYMTKTYITGYGAENYFIFPIGNFEYCWSPDVTDLFTRFEEEINGNYEDPGWEDEEEWIDFVRDIVIPKEYKIDNVCKSYDSNEISLNCRNGYYVVNIDYEDDIINKIWK